MDFLLMILSVIVGVTMTAIGIQRRQHHYVYKLALVIGISLIVFGIYLARPH